MPDINGIPYVDSTDLVSAYPTVSQALAQEVSDQLASKVDYALTANAQSGTGASAYTFVLADASRLTTATGTSAKTFTIPPQANVAWVANSIIRVANYGTGDLTIAGGSGVTVTNATKTLAQFESAALVRTGSNAWTLIPFSGGAGNADFSDAASGTYSDAGINYKWIQFTASGTLTVTRAGFADVLVVGGGGSGVGGITAGTGGGGGGAGGHLYATNAYLPSGSLTIVVGAGGSTIESRSAGVGSASRVEKYYAVGGGPGGFYGLPGQPGGSGGGGGGRNFAGTSDGGSGTGDQGNAGGNAGNLGSISAGGGGGANAAGGNASSNQGGNGGAGLANSITGSSVTRAGGGGGGSAVGSGGSGGSGGGGAGSTGTGSNGTANTGGGGGGSNGNNNGGNGGSGVVIVRVRV